MKHEARVRSCLAVIFFGSLIGFSNVRGAGTVEGPTKGEKSREGRDIRVDFPERPSGGSGGNGGGSSGKSGGGGNGSNKGGGSGGSRETRNSSNSGSGGREKPGTTEPKKKPAATKKKTNNPPAIDPKAWIESTKQMRKDLAAYREDLADSRSKAKEKIADIMKDLGAWKDAAEAGASATSTALGKGVPSVLRGDKKAAAEHATEAVKDLADGYAAEDRFIDAEYAVRDGTLGRLEDRLKGLEAELDASDKILAALDEALRREEAKLAKQIPPETKKKKK